MATIFYKQTKKGQYEPVRMYDPEFLDAWPAGEHVRVCFQNQTITRYNIDLDYVSLLAAAVVLQDVLAKTIVDITEAQPPKSLTPEAIDDWQQFIAKHGEEFRTLPRASAHDLAGRIVEAIVQQGKINTQNPSIFSMIEEFRAVHTLTQDTE